MKIFRLKKGSERRFVGGHPWVYSNEIQGSPKEIQPGELVEIQSPGGEFLALGYGNPHSLIFFRALSRSASDRETPIETLLQKRLRDALEYRQALGLEKASFRWIHGEGDLLPGLVLDLYRLKSGASVLVAQCHTAGMDRLKDALLSSAESVLREAKLVKDLAIVLRNDVSSRKLEGLEEATAIVKDLPGGGLAEATILVRGGTSDPHEFDVDLVAGQKTGFFLDQNENITQIENLLLRSNLEGKTVKVLDLCPYVGQWSTRLARLVKLKGGKLEATLVDASERALKFAERNVRRAGGSTQTVRGDVLRDLEGMKDEFDLVISDPPALIQGRKNIPQGTHAYLQLHTQAIRLTKAGGTLVACSCSQLLEEEEMIRTLQKAARRHGRSVRYFARGTQAVDHPLRLEFPEGRYLKLWAGRVETAL